MKRCLFLSGLILLTISFFSCDLYKIPKKIKISTEADYNFNILNIDYPLDSIFSPTQMIQNYTENSGMDVYDYNPGGNNTIQKYLLRMPVQEIPIDFKQYIEDGAIGAGFEAMSFNQEIEIPSIDFSQNENVDLEQVNTMINTGLIISGDTGTLVNISFQGGDFSTIEYKSGEMDVIAPNSDIPDGKVVKIVEVDDINAADPVITAEVSSGTFNNNKAVISLNNKTLRKENVMIKFVDESGHNFVATIREGSKIKKCTGVTVNDSSVIPELSYNFSIPAQSVSQIESCRFASGSNLKFGIEIPASWSGVSTQFTTEITGGLNIAQATEAGPVTKDLSNKDYNFAAINVDTAAKILLNNATIVFADRPVFSVKSQINGFSKITALLDESVQTDISINKPLSDEAKDMLKTITWKAGGAIEVKYTNTFPSGNDFELENVKSIFLNINQTTETLEAGKTNQTILFNQSSQVTNVETTSNVDLNAKLKVPGNTDGKLILNDVECGKKYKIDISIEAKLDWDAVEIKNISTESQKGVKYFDFNLKDIFAAADSTLGTHLANKVTLRPGNETNIYLFCDFPNSSGFENPHFEGTIQSYVGKKNGSDFEAIGANGKEYKIGGYNNPVEIPREKEPALTMKDNVVINKITGSTGWDLTPLINEATTTDSTETLLCVEYDLKFLTGSSESTITITKADLQNQTSPSIKIVAMLSLALDFYISAEDQIDVMKIMAGKDSSGTDQEKDLFGRSSSSDSGTIKEFLSIVEKARIKFNTTKKPFITSNPLKIVLDMDGDGTRFPTDEIGIIDGVFETSPIDLIETYPLCPSVKMNIPTGNFAVARDMSFATKIKLGLETNGKPLTVYPFGGE